MCVQTSVSHASENCDAHAWPTLVQTIAKWCFLPTDDNHKYPERIFFCPYFLNFKTVHLSAGIFFPNLILICLNKLFNNLKTVTVRGAIKKICFF